MLFSGTIRIHAQNVPARILRNYSDPRAECPGQEEGEHLLGVGTGMTPELPGAQAHVGRGTCTAGPGDSGCSQGY